MTKGDAIKQVGELLGCPEEKTFAIELDDSRAELARGPCDENTHHAIAATMAFTT